MRFNKFADVQPDSQTLNTFEIEESKALRDLLVGAVFVHDRLTQTEVEMLNNYWRELPLGSDAGPLVSEDAFARRSRMQERFHDEDELQEFIDARTERIDGEEKQLATLRLVSQLAQADKIDVRDVDYAYRVGYSFGMEHDTVDDVVRAVWESRQAAAGGGAEQVHSHPRPENRGPTHAGVTQTSPTGQDKDDLGRDVDPLSERPWGNTNLMKD